MHGRSVPSPAGLTNCWWQADVPIAESNYPLIEDLPPFPSVFREARLSCSGKQFDQQLRTWLQNRRFDLNSSLGAYPQVFSGDYPALSWGMDSTYLMIQLPMAVGMEAIYDGNLGELSVNVHFRPPLAANSFEMRIGRGLYDASLPALTLKQNGQDENGWDLATLIHVIEPGDPVKVWLNRRGMLAEFGWELTVDLGRALGPELKRERFITEWYQYGRQELAQEVEARFPGMRRGDRPSDAFELAISNALGALGFGVLFAGGILKTAGIDLVAFDNATHRAYAISAVTGIDIEKKLRTLVEMDPWLRRALEPEWPLRLVIITTQPGESLLEDDLPACHRRGVLVMTAEQFDRPRSHNCSSRNRCRRATRP